MAGDGDDEEDIVSGTESEGTQGSDVGGRDEDSEVPADETPDQEDDGGSESVEAPPAPLQQSRGANRIQRLANEAKAAREEAAAARREAEELRRAQAARADRETQEQRETRRALMTPEERMQDDLAHMRREFVEQQRQTQFQTAALMDKSAFDAKAAVNPIYQRYRDEIEQQFQRQLSLGRPVEREILLQNHLGKIALESASRSGGQRRQAKARVEQQRVSPGSGRGDTQSQRGKAGDTAESRLKDVLI